VTDYAEDILKKGVKIMKKLVTMALVIACAGCLLTTGLLAQTTTTPDEPVQPRLPSTTPTPMPVEKPGKEVNAPVGTTKEVYASTLIGASVKNLQGENLGKIDELVIDLQQARIKTAVVSMGGLLGIGSKSVAVPWSEVKSSDDGKTVIIAKAKDELENAPEWKKP
jgi:sporulation protein YlmC with PRC-barrel domain